MFLYKRHNIFFIYICFTFLLVFVSCSNEKPVRFLTKSKYVLYAKGSAAQEGIINFGNPVKNEYRFDGGFNVTPNSSIVIEYDFNFLPSEYAGRYTLLLNTGSSLWELPMNEDYGVNYAVPVDDAFNGQFSIELAEFDKADRNKDLIFRLHSLGFSDRFFGFSVNYDGSKNLTPFVFTEDSGYTINVPLAFMPNPLLAEITAVFSPAEQAALEFGESRIEAFAGTGSFYIPPELSAFAGYMNLSGSTVTQFLVKTQKNRNIFPKPIKADPAFIIAWQEKNWRNRSYEVFCWDIFPEILIFDYADYDVQDKMLKRLAFFVEKTGFRGRLAHDEEIRELHGWNAHDYAAQDLALFFDTARRENFPLSDEERELEKILLNEGIIKKEQGSIIAGKGAVISISRESPDYLRYRFMAHEGYHGLYFIDEDFREFCRQRWEKFPAEAKRFLISFFEFQQYDIKNEYLLYNEFMAHVLQQSVSQAADYFGRQLPLRLESTWRASSLPQKDETSGTWTSLASAFTQEARVFSDYVNSRWGFSAGRVWRIRVR